MFASVMMLLAGMFGIINGIAALVNDEIYVVTEDGIFLFDFTVWGLIHLTVGILAMFAGLSLLTREAWARFTGVVLAMASALSQLAFIPAFPLWSVVIIGIDVLVIYALLVAWEQVEPA
jgi:hypothetical protein